MFRTSLSQTARILSLRRPPVSRAHTAGTRSFVLGSAPTASARPSLAHLRLLRRLSSEAAPSASELSPNTGIKDKLKHLFKTYGWYTLGIYSVVTVLDFSFAFVTINLIGADKVSYAARIAKEYTLRLIGRSTPVDDGAEQVENDADKAAAANASDAGSGREGLYATAVLAYTIHKTLFLPFRVGITAAVTPKFVKFLQARGWAGAQGARQAGREMRAKASDLKDKAREKVQRKKNDD